MKEQIIEQLRGDIAAIVQQQVAVQVKEQLAAIVRPLNC